MNFENLCLKEKPIFRLISTVVIAQTQLQILNIPEPKIVFHFKWVFFTKYMFYVCIAIMYIFSEICYCLFELDCRCIYHARPWPLRSLNEICKLLIQLTLMNWSDLLYCPIDF